MNGLLRRFGGFRKDEAGSATVLALFMCLILLMIGGMAVDFQKRQSDQRHLQHAADVAAHTALYSRNTGMTADEAKIRALQVIANLQPRQNMDTAIGVSDIVFGYWDEDTRTFTPDGDSMEAVRVYAGMTEERGNATPNLLLHMIGFDTFNVAADSVYETYFPPCLMEGFVGDKPVDVQSNNFYGTGFCIHSNEYVSINQNNIFEKGSVVSMPDLNDLDIPNSGMEKNEGLEAALREGRYRFRILESLENRINGLADNDPEYMPDYITDLLPDTTLSVTTLTPLELLPGRTYEHTCAPGGKLTFKPGTYLNIVFVTDCEIKFENGAIIDESIIATRDTGVKSMNSPQGMQIGRSDGCNSGGGSSLLTLGGFSAASNLQAYNGQILAHKDIDFAAQASGVQGAAFLTYGEINSTSNMEMGFCGGDGMGELLGEVYFRMVD